MFSPQKISFNRIKIGMKTKININKIAGNTKNNTRDTINPNSRKINFIPSLSKNHITAKEKNKKITKAKGPKNILISLPPILIKN